jgi:GntR family transcriptional regulator
MILIDADSSVPLVDQIAQALRNAIACGEVRPGGELPAVRQLAGDLGVNLNTVARAYRLLEGEGLLKTARGRGTRVASDRDGTAVGGRGIPEKIASSLKDVLANARLAGVGRKDLESRIGKEIDLLWQRKKR